MSERRVPKVCQQCATEFAGKKVQRFCSRSCSVRSTNEARKADPQPLPETCAAEHPFTEENTYTTRDGRRICRECKRLRERDARRKAGKRVKTVKAVPSPVVEELPRVARPMWRPAAPGFPLRPGDEGYTEVAS